MYHTDLKFYVYRTDRAVPDFMKHKAIAGFNSMFLVSRFIESFEGIATDSFTKPAGDNVVVLDVLTANQEYVLFSPCGAELPSVHTQDGVTKQSLAEKFYSKEAGGWDYALPQRTLDDAVDKIVKNCETYNEDERYLVYRILVGGTVWYYPKYGAYGKVFGRPACLTLEAEELWRKYYSGVYND